MSELPTKPCELCTQPTTFLHYCNPCWEMQRNNGRWLPMETAPKNGERVLLRWPVYKNRVVIGNYYAPDREWQREGCVRIEAEPPTGWRPLPED